MSEQSPFSPQDLARWRSPGFTPGVKHVPHLLGGLALASDDEALILEKALLRAHAATPDPVVRLVLEALPASERPARGRLARLLGRLAVQGPRPELTETLAALTTDADLKTVLNAVSQLGHLPGPRSEAALLALWKGSPPQTDPEMRPEMRRALIRSLGKVGGVLAARALADYEPREGDLEERRLWTQARLILERDTARAAPSSLALTTEPPPQGSLILHSRRGLEAFVMAELRDLERAGAGPSSAALTVTPGRIVLDLGRLNVGTDGLVDALQKVRCAERWAFVLGGKVQDLARAGRIAEALLEALSCPVLQDWMRRSTRGPVRYRLDWPEATRGQIWSLAETLHREVPSLINDPTESLWEIGVIPQDLDRDLGNSGDAGRLIEVRPKALVDRRFAYRDAAVPASSHAPLAAALARLSEVRPDDLVWDPFCGAGTELIERALLGSYDSLWGTDLDPEALRITRDNMSRAGHGVAHLQHADARTWRQVRPTLIITNPPLGRRVARGEARDLLRTVAVHFADLLAPGGRLVWVSSFPQETRKALEQAGLKVTFGQTVDMGGFDAEIQRADKPSVGRHGAS